MKKCFSWYVLCLISENAAPYSCSSSLCPFPWPAPAWASLALDRAHVLLAAQPTVVNIWAWFHPFLCPQRYTCSCWVVTLVFIGIVKDEGLNILRLWKQCLWFAYCSLRRFYCIKGSKLHICTINTLRLSPGSLHLHSPADNFDWTGFPLKHLFLQICKFCLLRHYFPWGCFPSQRKLFMATEALMIVNDTYCSYKMLFSLFQNISG